MYFCVGGVWNLAENVAANNVHVYNVVYHFD